MKRVMILCAVWALAVARPELYKEKEDFQFSRSSTDEGSKSGFYGAQRGNMGGNYERAHNMDSLAQNQMSGLVHQVEGELGDGAKMRTGSVYTAANSRGTYGTGHYDLSNLAGRNFQEGTSYSDSQSQSSHSASSAYNAAAYANSRSQSSRHSGYQATGHSGLNLQSDDLQALTDHSQRTGQYDYGRHTSHAAGYNAQAAGYNAQAAGYNTQAAGYNAQSGFQQHAAYDASNTDLHSGGYGSNVHTRLISATPVRVIVRPGGRVAIPVAAQTYDLTQGSTLVDQNSLNTEAEVLSNNNQRTVYRIPGNAKHYESSYNYRKEWEKHDTIPSTVISPTTDSPFPKNSELYEDGQATRTGSEQYDTHRVDSQRAHSTYGGYNAAVKSTSGQSRFNYDTQRNAASHTSANAYSAGYGTNHQDTSSDSSLNGYNYQSQYSAGRHHGVSADALTQAAGHNTGLNAAADLNSQVENLNGKPKSYQSAYSYHKSWERQGDPYVIKPASSAYYDGQSAQRLTTGSTQNLGYLATGSQHQHSHASGADCDENGHIRVARSYNTDQIEDMQQQSQNLEDLGQQSQNLEDFGQQQSQNLEYFGQQQQNQNLEDFGQQQQSQNLEDFGQQQQSQNLDDFGQQQQSQNLDYFGQQQQRQKLEDIGQQQHKQNLEDLGQQVENLGQQTEVQWESQQEAGQQTQNTWDNLENLSQQTHNKWEDMQHTWDKFEDLGQKPQENQNDLRQRPQDTETHLQNNTHQQAQDKWALNFDNQDEQHNAHEHEQSNKFNQQETQSQLSDEDIFNYLQQSQKHNNDQMSVWDKFDLRSDRNIQQHKVNNEHTNSNGNPVNLSSGPQQVVLDQQLFNSGINAESQRVYHNENNGSSAEHLASTTQSHKIPDTYEQSITSGSHIHDGNFNMHTDQNQFSINENSFQETHRLHQNSNWYFSNSRRQETTNNDSHSHVSASHTISQNTAPLASLWDKLGNFEQTLVTSNVDKDEGNIFSQVQTNTQNSYGNSMHAYHNIDSTSQEHIDRQMNPYHDLMMAVVPNSEKDTIQNKSKVTKAEKESPLDVGRGDIGPEDLSDLKPENIYPVNTPKNSETLENQDQNTESKNKTNAHHNNQIVEHNDNTQGQHYFHQHHNFQEQIDSENMDQENLHVITLHETIEQPKQYDVEQHDVQDYKETLEHQNQQDFTQQQNKEELLSDYGQQVNVEQKNLQDFGKSDNMEQQNLHDFGQQVSVDQQDLQNFGKPDNMEQQNLQDFGQQINVDQQNLQDFGKPDNLEQQNLQDFGQQVYGEQQSLQDFGIQHNLQQQNKQDNLEEQNLQDFGQQAYLEQHNLQYFKSQDGEQHQNKNQEQLNQDPKEPHTYSKEERTAFPKNNAGSQTYIPPTEEVEELIVKKQSNDLHSISAPTPSTLATPTEPVTESTGFWKSIGNKFSKAKSKISSWF